MRNSPGTTGTWAKEALEHAVQWWRLRFGFNPGAHGHDLSVGELVELADRLDALGHRRHADSARLLASSGSQK